MGNEASASLTDAASLHLVREGKRTLTRKKILLLLQEECLDEVGVFFEKEYPGWQVLARMVTWPPTLVVAVEIQMTEGAREETEMLAELKQQGLIEFSACSPTTEEVQRKAEPLVAIWREEATEPYQILYEMNPSGQFVLVFPLERLDLVERIQATQVGQRDSGETLWNRFMLPAHANTALWLAEIREIYPEFVASQSFEAILDQPSGTGLVLIRSSSEEKRQFLCCWTVHCDEKERSSRCLHPMRSFEALPSRTPRTSAVLKLLRHVLVRSEQNVKHRDARRHGYRGGRSVKMPVEKSRHQAVSPMPLLPTCKTRREATAAAKPSNGIPQPLAS
jgi:hypothetical protein